MCTCSRVWLSVRRTVLSNWTGTKAAIITHTTSTSIITATTTTSSAATITTTDISSLLFSQVFYPGKSCNSRCVCSEGGNVKCDPKFSCSVNEKCVVKDGVASCAPRSVGSCSVSGVRNVRSFDGQVKYFLLKVSIIQDYV